jgi:NAD-dependent dihydropyrimidine dehydrogenase PreA subunit
VGRTDCGLSLRGNAGAGRVRRYNVITDRCARDLLCVSACLGDAYHPTRGKAGLNESTLRFIYPGKCIGCGSCLSACAHGAIVEIEELPETMRHFADRNAACYAPGSANAAYRPTGSEEQARSDDQERE